MNQKIGWKEASLSVLFRTICCICLKDLGFEDSKYERISGNRIGTGFYCGDCKEGRRI